MANSNDLIGQFIAGSSDPIVAVDQEGHLSPLNESARKMVAVAPEGVPHSLYADNEVLTSQLLAEHGPKPFDVNIYQPDGRFIRCRVITHLTEQLNLADVEHFVPEGSAICNLNTRSPFDTSALPELNPHPVLRTDRMGVVTYANPASRFLLQLFGGGMEEPLPEPLQENLLRCVAEKCPIDLEVSKDGFYYSLTFAPTSNSSTVNIYGADVTFRVRSEEKVKRMAREDSLTHLVNQSGFIDQLLHARDDHDPKHKLLAVLYIDLDRFTRINSTYGHQVGDAVLIQVAERLQACASEGCTLARIAGDQFCMLMENLESITRLILSAETILGAFEQPFAVADHSIELSCSLGISLNTKPHESPESLLHEADMAMRRAKVAGRGTMSVFDETMMQRVARSVSLERMMKEALAADEFQMYYQPKISVTDSCVVGFESLIRWNHPTEGMISPAEFIPLAEDTGIIVPVGDWIIGAVCRDLRTWLDAGIQAPPVAVNCSAIQIHREDFNPTIRKYLAEYDLAPHYFQVEVTESSLIEDMDTVIARLQELNDMGIKIFLDDFGTGFSSLQYLKNLPIHYLKVDQSFVKDMLTDKGDRTITSAIVAMARELGLKVIAEGVENRKQVYSLLAMGCNEIQGFYYSKPLPGPDIPAYLQQSNEKKFD